ncbi:MAG: DUF4091 domain-containing protein [Pirellulaceae bacterium]
MIHGVRHRPGFLGKTSSVLRWVTVLSVISGGSLRATEPPATDPGPLDEPGPVFVQRTIDPHGRVGLWLESSLQRVFPRSPVGERGSLRLLSARNAQVSFQACYRNESTRGITVSCSVTAPQGIAVTVRRVGYVPMWNHTAQVPPEELDGLGAIPGLVPDPLYPETTAVTGPYGTQSFWITLRIPSSVEPGRKRISVKLQLTDAADVVELPVEVDVKSLVLQPRRDFPVTHWWNPDCLFDWYKIEPFGDRWFELAQLYLRNMLDHGSDMIFVTLFHNRYEVVERPTQLLGVTRTGPDEYVFDWSTVRRFVRLARSCGFQRFEWLHLWLMDIKPDGSICSAARTIGIYEWKDGQAQLLFPRDYPATGDAYVKFLQQFLPEFHRFLLEEDLLDISLFHVSDEPGGRVEDIENYRKVRTLLRELAPWTDGKVGDAMSDIRYGKMGLIDFPIPNVAAAKEYIDAGIPHWVYYCCGPRGAYLNRFCDTPLEKIRMSGWLFYRHRALGFLHWGYNFWYVMDLGLNPTPQVLIDPFTDGAAGTTAGGEGEPYGDSFVVYPGPAGPIDSIRWEVFAESLQDYALLQTAGIAPDDPLLAPLRDYADFPKSEAWINQAIEAILATD